MIYGRGHENPYSGTVSIRGEHPKSEFLKKSLKAGHLPQSIALREQRRQRRGLREQAKAAEDPKEERSSNEAFLLTV